jgi:UDP-glucose 4-epimerase
MKVIVTGGIGYIGSHVVKRLLEDGHEVSVIDIRRGEEDDANGIRKLCHVATANCSVVSYMPFGIPDAVVHLAASAIVSESCQDPGTYWANNVTETQKLLAAMSYCKIPKLIFASSCSVYGNAESSRIQEHHQLQPVNPYGNTKLACDRMISDYCTAHGMSAVSLRLFNVAGCGAGMKEVHHPETHLIPRILAACSDGPPITIYGHQYDTKDGTAERDYVHVEDVADAFSRALVTQLAGHRVFNIGSGIPTSVLDATMESMAITGRQIRMMTAAARPGDPPRLVSDPMMARMALGWVAKRSVREMIESAWESMQTPSEAQVLTT